MSEVLNRTVKKLSSKFEHLVESAGGRKRRDIPITRHRPALRGFGGT